MASLSEYLTSKSLRQADFAESLGVTQGTVSRLVSKMQLPSLALALRIEKVTHGEVPVSVWSEPLQEKGAA